jgi:hypothetical protein
MEIRNKFRQNKRLKNSQKINECLAKAEESLRELHNKSFEQK